MRESMPKLTQWIRKLAQRSILDKPQDQQTQRPRETPAPRPRRRRFLCNVPMRRRMRHVGASLLPVLPSERRPLSGEGIGREHWATADSPFFLRLPPEIRQMVYVAMFGARTIHISLQYTTTFAAGKSHARLDTIKQADDRVREWRWWHCVCHRYRNLPFWNDRCLLPQYTSCRAHYGDHSSCFIGALEWLMTSRRCYTEAMPVLYGTNTFIVDDEYYEGLLFKLPSVLPSHRIRGVTSLELTSRVIPSGDVVDVGDHAALVQFLCSFFPNLRYLRLHIRRGGRFLERNAQGATPWLLPGVTGYPLISAAIFHTTDRLLLHYKTQLKCLEVALDKYIYARVLMVQPSEVVASEESHPRQAWRRFWREVITHDGLELGYYVMEAEDQVLIPIDTCL